MAAIVQQQEIALADMTIDLLCGLLGRARQIVAPVHYQHVRIDRGELFRRHACVIQHLLLVAAQHRLKIRDVIALTYDPKTLLDELVADRGMVVHADLHRVANVFARLWRGPEGLDKFVKPQCAASGAASDDFAYTLVHAANLESNGTTH